MEKEDNMVMGLSYAKSGETALLAVVLGIYLLLEVFTGYLAFVMPITSLFANTISGAVVLGLFYPFLSLRKRLFISTIGVVHYLSMVYMTILGMESWIALGVVIGVLYQPSLSWFITKSVMIGSAFILYLSPFIFYQQFKRMGIYEWVGRGKTLNT